MRQTTASVMAGNMEMHHLLKENSCGCVGANNACQTNHKIECAVAEIEETKQGSFMIMANRGQQFDHVHVQLAIALLAC